MIATFKLLNSYFWKTIYGPVITFALPILLLAILGNIMRIQYVYPGIIAMSLMFIGILALPLSMMELKQSSLFKYIGSSPVNPLKFSLVAIGYYIFIAILAACVILVGTMVFFHNDVFPQEGFRSGILGGIFGTIRGAGSFYFATALHLVMVIAFGLVIATFAKTPQQALTFAIVVILPSMFLSGMILSVDIIAKSQVMQWISRFIPFRYTTGNIVVASTPINQIGDTLSLLSTKEKAIIFNNVSDSGVVTAMVTNQKSQLIGQTIEIRNVKDLFDYVSENDGDYATTLAKDKMLFELIFVHNTYDALRGSDNNMFDWIQPWGVRRIPEVEQIKSFIEQYFMGEDGKGGDASRFGEIWAQIKAKDYTWLSLFLNQNNVLYTVADRVLNTAVPVALSGVSLLYVAKNFKWSSR